MGVMLEGAALASERITWTVVCPSTAYRGRVWDAHDVAFVFEGSTDARGDELLTHVKASV
jgi:hypothetical protein